MRDKRIEIRGYTSEDLSACRELWLELTQWHRKIYGDERIGGNDPGNHFDNHLRQVGNANIWVAVMNNEIVGLAGLIREEDGSAEIEPVVVKDTCRGMGVGTRLIESIVEIAKREGLKKLTVRPVARNGDAIQFFHSQGFNTLGHVQLILDFREFNNTNVWKTGPTLFDRNFRF